MPAAPWTRSTGSQRPSNHRHFSVSSAYVILGAAAGKVGDTVSRCTSLPSPLGQSVADPHFRVWSATEALFSLISCLEAHSRRFGGIRLKRAVTDTTDHARSFPQPRRRKLVCSSCHRGTTAHWCFVAPCKAEQRPPWDTRGMHRSGCSEMPCLAEKTPRGCDEPIGPPPAPAGALVDTKVGQPAVRAPLLPWPAALVQCVSCTTVFSGQTLSFPASLVTQPWLH